MRTGYQILTQLTRRQIAILGFVGTLLVAWAATYDGYAPSKSWHGYSLWPADASPLPEIVMVLGVMVLSLAWWLLRGNIRLPDRTMAASAKELIRYLVLWAVPLLLVPPVLSADMTLYADTGWILSHHASPYLQPLGTLGGPFAGNVDPLWLGHGVAYPPLTLYLNAAAVVISSGHPYWTFVILRLFAIAGVALAGWSMWLLTDFLRNAGVVTITTAEVLWLGLLNPIVVLHLIGGGHNDALMLGVGLAAVVLALRCWWQSAILVGIAMTLKQQAGLFVVITAGVGLLLSSRTSDQNQDFPLRRYAFKTVYSAVIALGVFGIFSWSSGLGFGWIAWLSENTRTGTIAPFSLLSQGIALIGMVSQVSVLPIVRLVAIFSAITVLGALIWIIWRWRRNPLAIGTWGAMAVTVLGPALQLWYLAWPYATLPLAECSSKRRDLFAKVLLFLVIFNAVQTVIWHSMPEWYVPR